MVKSRLKIPIYVMLRPRGGDFFYSDDEFEVLMEDLKLLKTIGADGFVFGFLNSYVLIFYEDFLLVTLHKYIHSVFN